MKCPILSWVSDLPDSGGSETNFEFDFYENLATEAIATLAHLSRAVAKLETQAAVTDTRMRLNDMREHLR